MIVWTGATTGFFTRLGKIGASLVGIDLFVGLGGLFVSSLTGNGTTATVTTYRTHGFTTNDTVQILNATPATFNGSYSVTVTSNTVFTFASGVNATATPTNADPILARKTLGVGFFNVGSLTDNIEATYSGLDLPLIDQLYSNKANVASGVGGFLTYLQNLAGNTVIQMANEDTPLATVNLQNAMSLVVSEMKTNAQTVQKPTITAVLAGPGTKNFPTALAAVNAAGGSLAATTQYFYKVTTFDQAGETTASAEANATTNTVNKTINLTWTPPSPIGSGTRIYRGLSTGAENLLVGTVTGGATASFSDAGTATTYTAVLPAANTTSTNVGAELPVTSLVSGNGLQNDYIFSEVMNVLCSSDGQSGGASVGQEQFSLTGASAETNTLAFDWPLGSGASQTNNLVDATVNASANNLLFNGGFDAATQTVNLPDYWALEAGVVGTSVLVGNALVYKGATALQFVGDGSTKPGIYQAFNQTGFNGTTSTLSPQTVYLFNCWIAVSQSPAAGVIEIALTDQNDNILSDAQGVSQAVTYNLTTQQPQLFLPFNGVLRTPAVLPTTSRIRVRESTALSNGITVYIDNLALALGIPAYLGGPFFQMFSGATAAVFNDSFTFTYTNSYNSQWQLLFERLFSMRQLGLQLPSGGSPTIADTLIA